MTIELPMINETNATRCKSINANVHERFFIAKAKITHEAGFQDSTEVTEIDSVSNIEKAINMF
ncbi:43779_t:CDS:2, partial [Gigaspora margarita]